MANHVLRGPPKGHQTRETSLGTAQAFGPHMCFDSRSTTRTQLCCADCTTSISQRFSPCISQCTSSLYANGYLRGEEAAMGFLRVIFFGAEDGGVGNRGVVVPQLRQVRRQQRMACWLVSPEQTILDFAFMLGSKQIFNGFDRTSTRILLDSDAGAWSHPKLLWTCEAHISL